MGNHLFLFLCFKLDQTRERGGNSFWLLGGASFILYIYYMCLCV